MSKISEQDVKQVAALARLKLSPEEIEKFQSELSGILGYVDQIEEVDTAGIEPTAQVTGLSDVVRLDSKVPSILSRDELLANAPEKKEGYIKVKPVME